MNFNIASKPDYSLNTRMIDECIRLYGTLVKFVMMDKITDGGDIHDLRMDKEESVMAKLHNAEAAVFNDFQALKTSRGVDGRMISREIHVLLNDTEGYPNGLAFAFNNFGLINDDTLEVFASIDSLSFLKGEDGEVLPKDVISNALIFPNNKVMEITNCQLHVPGVNNAFVYSDRPSAYLLSLKSFNFDAGATTVDSKTGGKNYNNTEEFPNIDDFFNNRNDNLNDAKDLATGENTIVTKCNEDRVVPSTEIDDVFGNC